MNNKLVFSPRPGCGIGPGFWDGGTQNESLQVAGTCAQTVEFAVSPKPACRLFTVAIVVSVDYSICFISDEADNSEMLGFEYHYGAPVGYSDATRVAPATERKVPNHTSFS